MFPSPADIYATLSAPLTGSANLHGKGRLIVRKTVIQTVHHQDRCLSVRPGSAFSGPLGNTPPRTATAAPSTRPRQAGRRPESRHIVQRQATAALSHPDFAAMEEAPFERLGIDAQVALRLRETFGSAARQEALDAANADNADIGAAWSSAKSIDYVDRYDNARVEASLPPRVVRTSTHRVLPTLEGPTQDVSTWRSTAPATPSTESPTASPIPARLVARPQAESPQHDAGQPLSGRDDTSSHHTEDSRSLAQAPGAADLAERPDTDQLAVAARALSQTTVAPISTGAGPADLISGAPPPQVKKKSMAPPKEGAQPLREGFPQFLFLMGPATPLCFAYEGIELPTGAARVRLVQDHHQGFIYVTRKGRNRLLLRFKTQREFDAASARLEEYRRKHGRRTDK